MANIDEVWGVEERAKLNRTIENPVRLTDVDPCSPSRERIISMMAQIESLQAEVAALKSAVGTPAPAPAPALEAAASKKK
jgi:hypothetical protein